MAEKGKCQVCSKISESRCSWCRLVFYCSKEHQKQDWESHKCSQKKKYLIAENEESGRHLVASEDLKPDYILLKDKPILLSIKANTLDFFPNKICLGCYKEIRPDDQEDDTESDSDQDGSVSEDIDSDDSSSSSSQFKSKSKPKSQSNIKSKKICEKCELPICSPECSSQYFHKAFECRLISEASPFKVEEMSPCTSTSGPDGTSSPTPPTSCSSTPTTEEPRETILKYLIYFRAILLKHVNPTQWEEMLSLKSNEEGRRDMPNLERTTRIFAILKRVLGQINHPTINQVYKPDVHKILGILDINALHFNISGPNSTRNPVTTPNSGSVGGTEVELSALFPTFFILEHSCIPNVRYYLSPTTTNTSTSASITSTDDTSASSPITKNKNSKYLFELFCRSSVKIKKGENLSISHANLMWNTEKRREYLKKERGIPCNCPRCLSPDELGSNFSTIICPQDGCKGYSVPVCKSSGSPTTNSNPSGGEIHWKCTKCGKFTPPWQVKKIDARLCEMVGRTKPSLESYKQLLAKMDTVHPDYYLCFVLNHSLLQMYGEDETSIHDTSMLEEKVALSNRLLHLIKKLDPGLAKLNIYTAVIYYEMQSAILAMAGGEVDDDFKTLRHKPETVKLAKLYLLKCIDCFKYEMLDLPENKLRNLAYKKIEYLDFILTKLNKSRKTIA